MRGGMAGEVYRTFQRRLQHLLDKTTVYPAYRWAALLVLFAVYGVRVYYLNGWYIVTYGLGIYMLNLFIGFLTPQTDPDTDGPLLPMNKGDEHRPFLRRVSEFKFWTQALKGVCTAFCMTFFSLFDVPVFWPILVLYFLVLFAYTMKNQIAHMVKYKYIPFSFGKAKYSGKPKPAAAAAASEPRFTGSNIAK